MIVPFSMIPGKYLHPLNVQTKMEYTINKRKFPGLNDKVQRAQPALVIASKDTTDASNCVEKNDLPIDYSAHRPRKTKTCRDRQPSRQDIVTRTKSQRVGHTSNRAGRLDKETSAEALDLSKTPKSDLESLDRLGQIINIGPNTNISSNSHLSSDSSHLMSAIATTATAAAQRAPVQTHPSYLDFIYGENGIIAKMAAKGNVTAEVKKSPDCTSSKQATVHTRKRKRVEDVVSAEEEELNLDIKRSRVDCCLSPRGTSAHTIHYMPNTTSIVCGGKSGPRESAFSVIGTRELWSGAPSLGFSDHFSLYAVPQKRFPGRQS